MFWLSFMNSNGKATPGNPNSAQQHLKVHYMKGCSPKGKNLKCIHSKAIHKDHIFRKDIWKTALMGTLSFYSASRDVHSLFWIP